MMVFRQCLASGQLQRPAQWHQNRWIESTSGQAEIRPGEPCFRVVLPQATTLRPRLYPQQGMPNRQVTQYFRGFGVSRERLP